MATAAPAAPSPSAPAVGGQPEPGASPAAPATSTPSTDAAPAAKAKPTAKPIRLPGVFPDDDPFPSPPSSDKAPAARPRDASGRFAPDAPSEAGREPAAEEHTGEPEPSRAKLKFLGEDFDSIEAVEQNVKSLRGQFKPLQAKAAQADHFRAQLGQAAESARAWKAEADRLNAELQGRGGSQPQPATPGDGPNGAEGDTPGVDWELYAEIERIANEKGEGWRARQWLQEQTDKVTEARVQRMLDKQLEPVQSATAKAALAEHTEKLFANLATYTTSDGSPAFPELSDESAAYEVGRIWASMGLPRAAALSPQGAIAAIAMYRMAKAASQGKPAASTPAPGIAPGAEAPASMLPTDISSAATMDDGRPSVARPGAVAGTGPSAEAAAILQGLRASRSTQANRLGFEP